MVYLTLLSPARHSIRGGQRLQPVLLVLECLISFHIIPQTLGESIPYKYTNLKTDAHTYNTKHTHTPLSHPTKNGTLLASAAEDGVDFTFYKTHTRLSNTQFTHKQEFMLGVHNILLLPHNPTLRCPMTNSTATATWPVTAPPSLA
jgi:hypothetical protein